MRKKVKITRSSSVKKAGKASSRVRTPAPAPVTIYSMTCSAGSYQAGSWLALGWAVLTHRIWHLWKHGRWMD